MHTYMHDLLSKVRMPASGVIDRAAVELNEDVLQEQIRHLEVHITALYQEMKLPITSLSSGVE